MERCKICGGTINIEKVDFTELNTCVVVSLHTKCEYCTNKKINFKLLVKGE